jgi:hypothetical protein
LKSRLKENFTPGSVREVDLLLRLNTVALLVPKGRSKQRIQSIPKMGSLDLYSTCAKTNLGYKLGEIPS